jgi:Transposase DDE domain
VARPRQPARRERAAERPALGNHPGRRRHQRDHPRAHRNPHRAGPALPRGHRVHGARQALLIERYTTYKKKGQWHTRAEAVLYLTSLAEDETTPEDLLAHVRGHWRVEHAHWLRDVIWKEDKSLIRTGNAPQVWSAITNLVISLFRIHGVTSYTAETRRCAQDPRRALQILDLTALSPG